MVDKRVNKACRYFPCHKGLEDCTFCYCPFYPCLDENLGRFISVKAGERIWSCLDCNWIHKKRVVDDLFCIIRNSNYQEKTDLHCDSESSP